MTPLELAYLIIAEPPDEVVHRCARALRERHRTAAAPLAVYVEDVRVVLDAMRRPVDPSPSSIDGYHDWLARVYGLHHVPPECRAGVVRRAELNQVDATEGAAAPRPVDAITTHDQARAGGCCICPPNCAGSDPLPDEHACDPLCVWCHHGCSYTECVCVKGGLR